MKIEVTLTKEQYEAFSNGESITLVPPKKKYVIEYGDEEDECLYNIVHCDTVETQLYFPSTFDKNFLSHGRYRKTKENAEYSLKENQKRNLLEALVEDLQGELGAGAYTVCFDYNGDKKWHTDSRLSYCPLVGEIRMKLETAEKVCELLNNKQYSLEG